MERKRAFLIILALLVLALVTTACDDTGYSGQAAHVTPTPRIPSARELAAVETAQAEETTAAMEKDAKGTAEALELERRATQQVQDLKGTQEQAAANATADAWWFAQTQEAANLQATATAEARQATATRQSIDATATTEAHQATATAAQWAANVQGTQAAADAFAVEATRRAVERADERETVTQPLRAWWAWVILALAVPALIWCGWRIAKTAEDRARVVRRKADEGEPLVLLEQKDKDGNRRIALPLRSFHALMDTGEVPQLPAPEYQEAATMRQQTTNAIQARQAAQIAEAKSKRPKMLTQNVILPAEPQRTQARRRQIPGIVKVVAAGSLEEAKTAGLLSPPLADSIEAEWSDVTGED